MSNKHLKMSLIIRKMKFLNANYTPTFRINFLHLISSAFPKYLLDPLRCRDVTCSARLKQFYHMQTSLLLLSIPSCHVCLKPSKLWDSGSLKESEIFQISVFLVYFKLYFSSFVNHIFLVLGAIGCIHFKNLSLALYF